MITEGYILLARKLCHGDLMDKPHLYFKLWVWMLERANWKNREKLKRGQFVVTIAEMQQEMSYMVGFRRETPSKDEIRSAYEYFMKTSMITTAKTTRGMIVTIENYDLYQSRNNYEPRSESSNESSRKTATSPHDTERKGKKKKERNVENTFISPSEEDVEAYMTAIGYTGDPKGFVDFYTSKGWMIGSNKMKDWKAAVRNWQRKDRHSRYDAQQSSTEADRLTRAQLETLI